MGEVIIKLIKSLYRNILDVIYPANEICLACESEGFIGLCPCCKASIKRASEEENNISYGFYGGALKKLILEFKYRKNFVAGDVLSNLLIELIKEKKINADMICYVPMTNKAIKKRGFNQCEIVARNIGHEINIQVNKCLIKKINTKEQKTLSKEERIKNIQGVFEANKSKNISGKRIILIDDVTTTGATVNECKKVLKKRGADKIIILTIAKSNI